MTRWSRLLLAAPAVLVLAACHSSAPVGGLKALASPSPGSASPSTADGAAAPAASGGARGQVISDCGTTADQLTRVFGMPMANDYSAEMVAGLSHNGGIPHLYKQARYVGEGMVEVVPQPQTTGGAADDVSDRCSWTAGSSGNPQLTVELSADRGAATMSVDAVMQALQDQLGTPMTPYAVQVPGFDWRTACTDQPTGQGKGGACVGEAFRLQGTQATEIRVWVHNYGDPDSAPEMLTDKAMAMTVRNALSRL